MIREAMKMRQELARERGRLETEVEILGEYADAIEARYKSNPTRDAEDRVLKALDQKLKALEALREIQKAEEETEALA